MGGRAGAGGGGNEGGAAGDWEGRGNAARFLRWIFLWCGVAGGRRREEREEGARGRVGRLQRALRLG